MKITLQMIVFNAVNILPDKMLERCLASIYPYVDQMIIVEGATMARSGKHRWDGNTRPFTASGKSTDTTLAVIRAFDDPQKKITLIPAVGFWDGKTTMFNAGLQYAKGDYIWHVDADEFYLDRDMSEIRRILEEQRPDAIHFYANHFVGGFKHIINGETGKLWGNDLPWMRIFRRDGPACKWRTHEPPDFLLTGGRACNEGRVVTRDQTQARGIRMFHYGYAARSQAQFKARFFNRPEYVKMWDDFQRDKATKWIRGTVAEEFCGEHPHMIKAYL